MAAKNKKEKFDKKLNTKGCCFLCLTVIDFKIEVKNNDGDNDGDGTGRAEASKEHSSVSLRILIRYLNINLDKLSFKNSSSDVNKESSSSSRVNQTEDPKVDLCESCGRILDKFSKLFLSLEKIQLEMGYWLGRIYQQISNASKNSELVQNYSKRMTSDPDTLTQLVFIDNLRKEISKMSLETNRRRTKANVKLQQLNKSQMYPAKISTSGTPDSAATKEKSEIDHRLLKFEDQEEEYYEEADLDQTPPNSPPTSSDPPVLSPPTLSESCTTTTKKKCFTDGKAILITRTKFKIKSASNSSTKKYVCTKCKKEFASGRTARQHYDAIHLHRKWKCDICKNSTFAYPQDLQRHMKTCRNSLQKRLLAFKAKQNDPRYKQACPNCGMRFKKHSEMLKHNRLVHLKEKNYGCDLCSKTFPTLSCLKVHKNAVHLGITLKCGACSKEFKYKHHLKRHKGKCKDMPGVC